MGFITVSVFLLTSWKSIKKNNPRLIVGNVLLTCIKKSKVSVPCMITIAWCSGCLKIIIIIKENLKNKDVLPTIMKMLPTLVLEDWPIKSEIRFN